MVQIDGLDSWFHPLNDGHLIPSLGLGTYQARDGETSLRAFGQAIEIGYRHFDSAAFYANERSVGKAIRNSGLPRSEFYVTTKLWNSDHGYDETLRAFERSFELLDVEYVDLYLIHWPVAGKRRESWHALETLVESDRCRSIGVSNYMVHHLEELLDSCLVVPAVNQIELHPFVYGSRLDTIDYCQQNDICIEAYSPLTKGRRLADPTLTDLARQYDRSPAQILIRWAVQHDFVVLPKSTDASRMRENASVFDFEISQNDMDLMDALDRSWTSSWDPSDAP